MLPLNQVTISRVLVNAEPGQASTESTQTIFTGMMRVGNVPSNLVYSIFGEEQTNGKGRYIGYTDSSMPAFKLGDRIECYFALSSIQVNGTIKIIKPYTMPIKGRTSEIYFESDNI